MIGCMAAVYKDGVMHKLFQLPVLHPNYSWSWKIFTSVEIFCDFLLMQCGTKDYSEASRCISRMKTDICDTKLSSKKC